MTDGMGQRPVSDQCLIEAVQWRIRLTEADAQTSPEFEAWLSDPANSDAWQRMSWPWDVLGSHAHTPELVAERQLALGNARSASGYLRTRTLLKRGLPALAATILLILGISGGEFWLNRPDSYRTGQGERRVIMLSDGSKLSLDADSEVLVRFTRGARTLELLQGQAQFDVSHNSARPFSVTAGSQKVVATGTAFNIDIAGPKVIVTLIEGHVVVLNEATRASDGVNAGRPYPVELKSGQQLTATPATPPEIETVDTSRVTAWTNGQIVFDNQPLSLVVAHVNRYSTARIAVDDPRVGSLRISGTLNAGDVAGFIDIVTHYLPVRAVPKNDDSIVLESKNKTG
jgi:transmembrane sensor